jgi:hypothetical protein
VNLFSHRPGVTSEIRADVPVVLDASLFRPLAVLPPVIDDDETVEKLRLRSWRQRLADARRQHDEMHATLGWTWWL